MKAFKAERALGFALLVGALLLALGMFSQNGAKEQQAGEDAMLALADSNSLLGSYLAGRLARVEKDIETAADYYSRALERDPGNEAILGEAFQLELSAGKLDKAVDLARRLVQTGDGEFALAYLLLGTDAFEKDDMRKAIVFYDAVGDSPVIELTGGLAKAWVDVARGKNKAALKRLSRQYAADRSRYFQHLHTALIADLGGDRNLARTNYARAFKEHSDNRRLVEAYARHAAHWGDSKLALNLLKRFAEEQSSSHAVMDALAEQIKEGTKVDLLVTTPREGLSEVFFGIGGVLAGNRVNDVARIYLHLSLHLTPDHDNANYLLGEVEAISKRYEAAIQSYDKIPESSSLWVDANIRKAFILSTLKRNDEAIATLKPLVEARPSDQRLLQALGNIYRDDKKYAEAAELYSRAIDLIEKPSDNDWIYYYSRGICYERLKIWPKAEADLRKALEFNPDQPAVLNYLGYSWVDQNLNLEEAMDLIRKAVRLKPNNGYFVDSLGWAYYRLGNYEEAVRYLERAVELRPEDPVINDHLGDSYWRVGRRLEARYQWSQAMDLDPEPADAEKIRAKMEHGLDGEPEAKAALKNKVEPDPLEAPRAAE